MPKYDYIEISLRHGYSPVNFPFSGGIEMWHWTKMG